ncbi:hypothetical protein B0F90DRAFT_631559 [Multifurca ochricompacta]|uniref:DUF6535 domain-containing protein n=1 Tax=Multifurca ochricompacta TaxID=376703 RepID=A0AAD4M1Y7_9AGAM|nr:hypothetical protein B0F90DRAFT_631559 [Multifurca ochricompacta]
MSPDVKLFPRSVFTGETAAGGPNSPHYVLLSTQNSNSPSQADSESNFTDGSDTLFSMYNDKTAEYDRKLAENWREDANGVMILSGLFSATVAGFLSQSYLTSQTSSQDVSAFYLGQIYQLQASSNNNTNVTPLAVPPTTAPTPTIAHALWFASLVLSLSSAVFATLVQEWVRRYLLMTQPRSSPHRRARIRAFITQEGSLVTLQRTVNSLHSFLHLSIFFFLLGLIALASNFGGPLVLPGTIPSPSRFILYPIFWISPLV